MSEWRPPAPFTEIADRVWVARYEWFDVNVTVIGGADGLLVVDTHASGLAARTVVDDVRRLAAGEVRAVVNTHEHFDHTFGNATFRAAYGAVPIHAHETAAERTVPAGERVKALYDARGEPRRPAPRRGPGDRRSSPRTRRSRPRWRSTSATGRSSSCTPGAATPRATSCVLVPDADVLLAGDLVEESMVRQGVPGFGDDCYPMEWPLSLDIVLGLTTSASVVVPGHGAPVDRDFVEEQRNAIGVVAETIRDLATRGVPVAEALDAAEWPYPREELAAAVRRGYEHLPRAQKRLPLV